MCGILLQNTNSTREDIFYLLASIDTPKTSRISFTYNYLFNLKEWKGTQTPTDAIKLFWFIEALRWTSMVPLDTALLSNIHLFHCDLLNRKDMGSTELFIAGFCEMNVPFSYDHDPGAFSAQFQGDNFHLGLLQFPATLSRSLRLLWVILLSMIYICYARYVYLYRGHCCLLLAKMRVI